MPDVINATITAPIIKAFTITGGKHASALTATEFLSSFPILIVRIAATNVAKEPAAMSIIPYGLNRFATKQPMNKPGTAIGKKNGSMHKTSAKRNCTAPYDKGATAIVNIA